MLFKRKLLLSVALSGMFVCGFTMIGNTDSKADVPNQEIKIKIGDKEWTSKASYDNKEVVNIKEDSLRMNEKMDVVLEGYDNVASVSYAVTENPAGDIDKLSWKNIINRNDFYSVSGNVAKMVYIKVVDSKGNKYYASTQKMKLDMRPKVVTPSGIPFDDKVVYIGVADDNGIESVKYSIIKTSDDEKQRSEMDISGTDKKDINFNEGSMQIAARVDESEVPEKFKIKDSSNKNINYYKFEYQLDKNTYALLRIVATDGLGQKNATIRNNEELYYRYCDYTLINTGDDIDINIIASYINQNINLNGVENWSSENLYLRKRIYYENVYSSYDENNSYFEPGIVVYPLKVFTQDKKGEKSIGGLNDYEGSSYVYMYLSYLMNFCKIYYHISENGSMTNDALKALDSSDDESVGWKEGSQSLTSNTFRKVDGNKYVYIKIEKDGVVRYKRLPKIIIDSDKPEFNGIENMGSYNEKIKFEVKDTSGVNLYLDYKDDKNKGTKIEPDKDGKYSLKGINKGKHTLTAIDKPSFYFSVIPDSRPYLTTITINVKASPSSSTYVTPSNMPTDSTPVDDGTRVSGDNRVETSIKLSQGTADFEGFNSADTVYLVSKKNNIDALSVAGITSGKSPIIYTDKDSIPKIVMDEIKRLKAKNIKIVGGMESISDIAIDNLKKEGFSVDRLYGDDRYQTAANIADEILSKNNQKKIIIASGQNYADALSISGYSAKSNIPVLLVTKDKVPDSVKGIISKYGIKEIEIIGGENSVSKEVEKELKSLSNDLSIKSRLAGVDRYETSLLIAKKYFSNSKGVYLASGQNPADALVVGPLSGKNNKPVILTKKDGAVQSVKKYVSGKKITIIGGRDTIGKI